MFGGRLVHVNPVMPVIHTDNDNLSRGPKVSYYRLDGSQLNITIDLLNLLVNGRSNSNLPAQPRLGVDPGCTQGSKYYTAETRCDLPNGPPAMVRGGAAVGSPTTLGSKSLWPACRG